MNKQLSCVLIATYELSNPACTPLPYKSFVIADNTEMNLKFICQISILSNSSVLIVFIFGALSVEISY